MGLAKFSAPSFLKPVGQSAIGRMDSHTPVYRAALPWDP
jgi:hypothetical protein